MYDYSGRKWRSDKLTYSLGKVAVEIHTYGSEATTRYPTTIKYSLEVDGRLRKVDGKNYGRWLILEEMEAEFKKAVVLVKTKAWQDEQRDKILNKNKAEIEKLKAKIKRLENR